MCFEPSFLRCIIPQDGVLQTLKIKGNQVEVMETLTLVEPVSSVCFSPNHETMLLSSNTVSKKSMAINFIFWVVG